MARLADPAVRAARAGVVVDGLQSYIINVVKPIYLASEESRAIFESRERQSELVQEGEILRQPQLANTIAGLAEEGDGLFYEGELAERVDGLSRAEGGHLRADDFRSYRIAKRKPLQVSYRRARLLTNPPPSSGGLLVAFALKLLEAVDVAALGVATSGKLSCLAHIMSLTNKARVESQLRSTREPRPERVLDQKYLELYRTEVLSRASATLGTTHISVIDVEGNVASMSSSNGEGCGYLIPDTGIPLNNMLGEEDLNPGGFNRWREDQRMTSMMAPTILREADGTLVALGSGGSNRLRTAILQVLTNLIDHGLPLDEAVCRPRIHHENELLNVESGFDQAELAPLIRE